MKRLWVVGTLSLALAGCAQSRSALSKRDGGTPAQPVAVTPVPSVYDTVNRGLGGPAVARTIMKDPNDPKWNGRAQLASAARPVADGPVAGEPSAAQSPPPAMAAAPAAPYPGPAQVAQGNELPAMAPAQPAMATPAAPTGGMASARGSTGPGSPALTSVPASGAMLEPSSPDVVGSLGPMAAPAPMSSASAPATMATPSSAAISPAMVAPDLKAARPADLPPMNTLSLAAPPADLAVSPSAAASVSAPAITPAPPARSAAAAARRADPLLGPDPELMPSMPELPSEKPAAAEPAGPAPAPAAPAAASLPELPDLSPAPAPEAPGPTSSTNPPASASLPAIAGKLVSAAAIEPAPTSAPGAPAANAAAAVSTAALGIAPKADNQIARTAGPTPANGPVDLKNPGIKAGGPVARVGDEIITFHDLVIATRDQLKRQPGLAAENPFDSGERLERRKQIDMLAKYTLDGLIERSILVQEAKHAIKDSKQMDLVMGIANKVWKEEQLPQLERLYNVDSEQKLKAVFTEQHRSLDQLKKAFEQDFLAQSYMHDRLKDKLRIELPDLLKYYNDHMHDPEFQRPAKITWREVVIETDKYPTREAARQKAAAIAAKLRQGADFAQVAAAESDGPSSARNQGGLMQTSPGSYAVEPVNQALATLPIGKASEVLEGPTSFHIVRVEKRRAAGPATFEEVRNEIRPMLFEEKVKTERAAFIKKLRERTLISTIFDASQPTTTPTLQAAAR